MTPTESLNPLSIEIIKNKLQNPLPGIEAHIRLFPAFRKEELEKSDQSKAIDSAVLALLFFDEDKLKTVFIRRASDHTVHSGQISFPGGKAEPYDKTPEMTAMRECEEEIGVDASRIKIIGKLTPLFIPRSNFLVHPFVGFIDEKPVFNPDINEVEYVIETEVLIHDPDNPDSAILEPIEGIKLDVLGYNLGDDFLWGATGMIFTELLMILKT